MKLLINALKQKKKKVPRREVSISVLSDECRFSGSLISNHCRIEGQFEGELISHEMVTASMGSVIEAKLHVKNVILAGRFNGTITASGFVRLMATAEVEGTIECASLEVESGAVFNGRCRQSYNKNIFLPVKYNPGISGINIAG